MDQRRPLFRAQDLQSAKYTSTLFLRHRCFSVVDGMVGDSGRRPYAHWPEPIYWEHIGRRQLPQPLTTLAVIAKISQAERAEPFGIERQARGLGRYCPARASRALCLQSHSLVCNGVLDIVTLNKDGSFSQPSRLPHAFL